jgi:SAM-dependent MidA family methyltransferase
LRLPPHLARLPPPDDDALAASDTLAEIIRLELARTGGWMSFARFMQQALYAPGLGYYMGGARKLGAAGDFITAPEMTRLFGRTLARQLKQVFAPGANDVLEVGAGSGALAADLLLELEALDAAPASYAILELSADMRERALATIARRVPAWSARIQWLERLPETFSGVILGNEVLDAMPAHLLRTRGGMIEETGVVADGDAFAWRAHPAEGALLQAAAALGLPEDYSTEVNLAARAWLHTVSTRLERGLVLLIDYGFPAREYYHPQRSSGTLMCHYRQHAHTDPLCLPGLQDITTHVDFSALAAQAQISGLELKGYATQAQFLINCGITALLAELPPERTAEYLPLAAQAQKLLSPAEMGELFKVIALGRGVDAPLIGFAAGDKSHSL